jgi:hypothetical protein
MQRPTQNVITQTAHLDSQAVDYSWYPDPTIYAPEDGRVESYGVAGDCGNNLRISSTDHIHSLCHLEKSFVFIGEYVRRGQPVGVMGYTGKTIPAGPSGRHLHHFIRYNDGRYVYPPSIVNEPFIKGDEEMITREDVGLLRIGHSEIGGWDVHKTHAGDWDKLFMDAWLGKPVKDFIWAQWNAGAPYRAAKAQQEKALQDLNASLSLNKAELAAAKVKLDAATIQVEEAVKQATEAGIKAAELEKEKKADEETGNAFLRFLARLFKKGEV